MGAEMNGIAKVQGWAPFVKTTLAALSGAAVAIFASGRAEGRDQAIREAVHVKVDDHDLRIRSIELRFSELSTDVRWLRAALSTGRDPVTNQPLPLPPK